MVATNYKMKERTRRPMRRQVEEEDKEEEEEGEEGEVVGSELEVDSAVTMEGRVILEGVTRLPRGVVEV